MHPKRRTQIISYTLHVCNVQQFLKFHVAWIHILWNAHYIIYLRPSLTTIPSVMKRTIPPRIWIIKKDTGSPRRLSFWQQLKISPWPVREPNVTNDRLFHAKWHLLHFFHPNWLKIHRGKICLILLKITSPPASWLLCSTSGPSAPCWFSIASSSLSSRRGVPLGQHGMSCSRYIRNRTAMGTGSWGCTNNIQLVYVCNLRCTSNNVVICSYIDKRHDPERIVHIGLLFPCLMGQVALGYVVICNRTVSQHVSEMMYELTVIGCVIPTACLWEERICNQWAHQGSEPNEEMKSLKKATMYVSFTTWLLLHRKYLLNLYISGERWIKHKWTAVRILLEDASGATSLLTCKKTAESFW